MNIFLNHVAGRALVALSVFVLQPAVRVQLAEARVRVEGVVLAAGGGRAQLRGLISSLHSFSPFLKKKYIS